MSNAIKKLKADEKKIIMSYAINKLQFNRLSKELDTMKQNVVDVFERTNQNLVIVQDENCLLYTSPSPRDGLLSRMPSSA